MTEGTGRPPYEGDGRRDGQAEDVLLDVSKLDVQKIELEVDNLRARVSLNAEVLSLLRLNIGAEAEIEQVRIDIEGVEAQAMLKVRLGNVAQIVERVLATLDAHPEIIKPLVENAGQAIGQAGRGIGSAVSDTGRGAGEAVRQIGAGAGEATGEVGRGAGEAVGEVGRGAGSATEEVGRGAGEATGEVGRGAGEATGEVGRGAGEAAGEAGRGAGDAVRDVGGDHGEGLEGHVDRETQRTTEAVPDGEGRAKKVTERTTEAAVGDPEKPDIEARSRVAADQGPSSPNGSPNGNGRKRRGLPRRPRRRW